MYEGMTDDFLRERMLARVSDKFDKRPSALIYDTHEATANELAILYLELEFLIRNSYGDTAAREFLILLCKDRGITPEPATHAVLKGVFSPETVDVRGKRFNVSELNYVVTEKISSGEYQVRCEAPGRIGNQYFGQMIPIEYIQGLESAELTEVLIPGEEEEETEALRKRYLNSFNEQAFGGNRADYLAKVRSMDGIGDVKVTRIWNGDIRPADMFPAEEVRRWYESVVESLSGEIGKWLSLVYTAAAEKKLTVGGTVLITVVNADDFGMVSDVLLDKVQTALDPEANAGEGYGLAPIGHVVSVKSAIPVKIKVQSTLTFESEYSWGRLQTEIEKAVEAYFLELRKNWAASMQTIVRISQIEARILGIQGIVDISGTKLNQSPENLILDTYEIPVSGGVSE